MIRASPALLYDFFTTPSSLVRWFCEKVDTQRDNIYAFTWSGYDEIAKLTEDVEEELVRYTWLAPREDEYLEFKISQSRVTSETILEITDFCDEDEVEQTKALWDSQIQALKKETGSGSGG